MEVSKVFATPLGGAPFTTITKPLNPILDPMRWFMVHIECNVLSNEHVCVGSSSSSSFGINLFKAYPSLPSCHGCDVG